MKQSEYFPQSWNQYSYAKNTPLALIDPLGLAACRPTVKLHRPNDNKSDEVSGEFGPYQPQGDSAAGEQAADPPGYSGCAGGGGWVIIDGVEVPAGLAGGFEAIGGGPLGGGSPSGVSYGCVDWMACEGVTFKLTGDNTIAAYRLEWQMSDPFQYSFIDNGVFNEVINPTGGYRFVAIPSEACGINPFCDFADGFSDIFLNGRPGEGSVRLGGSLAVGFAGAVGVGAAVAYGSEALSAVAEAPSVIQDLAFRAYTSPAFWESLQQFGEGLNPAVVPPATLWGAAGFAAGEIYQNWNNWF